MARSLRSCKRVVRAVDWQLSLSAQIFPGALAAMNGTAGLLGPDEHLHSVLLS
jgi:hypothetical protein